MATFNFSIPELAAAQSQKHVTVNEALRVIDAAMNLNVLRSDLSAPPGSPIEGSKYIVAAPATGQWIGRENQIAAFINAIWVFFIPQKGWRAYNQVTNELLVYTGSAWSVFTPSSFGNGTAIRAANGGGLQFKAVEEEVTGLTGNTASSSIVFPNQCLILGVSTRVTSRITGASSFDCGDSSNVARFGGLLNVSAGSTNQGTIGPSANYAPTNVVLTANGPNFTGGSVRVCLTYLELNAPTS